MVGPTQQGVTDIIAQDPGAYWDGTKVANSNYTGNSSPRICKILLVDSGLVPDVGRTQVTVTRLGVFFIEGMQGQDLIGRYIRIATTGELESGGGGGNDLYGVKLVQ
jgi:hypothetical protein